MKIECSYLSQFPHLKHGFFEENSKIISSEQDEAMMNMAGCPLALLTLKQVHGNTVLQVSEPWAKEKTGDGLVTNLKGIGLGIRTADCGPVLFYDPVADVIGACHAGWKGAKAGILQSTLDGMEEIGAKRSQIYATLGPTIQQQNYEVGPEFPDLIHEPYDSYFYPSKKNGHHYFDLPKYICQQLLNEGLAKVHNLGIDTFTGNFASRRRFLSKGQKFNSDNLSAIAIV